MTLWLPPVSDEVERQRADLRAAAVADLSVIAYWNEQLQAIDPGLQLIKARPNVETPGLRPGYWHVVRDVPPAPPTLLPLVGEHGEYVEPTSRMLDVLREGDLQNDRAMRDRAARDEAAAKQRLKDKFHAHEDRVGSMVERVESANRTHVSMREGWVNSVDGRRAA